MWGEEQEDICSYCYVARYLDLQLISLFSDPTSHHPPLHLLPLGFQQTAWATLELWSPCNILSTSCWDWYSNLNSDVPICFLPSRNVFDFLTYCRHPTPIFLMITSILFTSIQYFIRISEINEIYEINKLEMYEINENKQACSQSGSLVRFSSEVLLHQFQKQRLKQKYFLSYKWSIWPFYITSDFSTLS